MATAAAPAEAFPALQPDEELGHRYKVPLAATYDDPHNLLNNLSSHHHRTVLLDLRPH
jgi:hypothetical protein